MAEIDSVASALQTYQSTTQSAVSVTALKLAAQAERELADMLAKQAKAAASAARGRISIYV